MNKQLCRVWAITNLLALMSLGAQGASFDCKKAKSISEHVICSEAAASRLDEDINFLYGEWRYAGGAPFKMEQKAWLDRRNACKDRACTYQLLNERKEVLLRGADSFMHTEGKRGDVAFGVAVGLKKGNIEWLSFSSVRGQGAICDIRLKNVDGLLIDESGMKFIPEINDGGVVVRLNQSANGEPTQSEFCGIDLAPPESLRIKGSQILVSF